MSLILSVIKAAIREYTNKKLANMADGEETSEADVWRMEAEEDDNDNSDDEEVRNYRM